MRRVHLWSAAALPLLIALPSSAQASALSALGDASSARTIPAVTSIDQEGSRRWSVGTSIEFPVNAFAVSTMANTQSGDLRDPLQDLTYAPSFAPIASVRLAYGEWALRLSRRLGTTEDSGAALARGKSLEEGLRFQHFFGKFGGGELFGEVYYHSIRGMSTDVSIRPEVKQTVNRSDLRYRNFGTQFTAALPLNESGQSPTLRGLHERPVRPDSPNGDFELLAGANLGHFQIEGDRPFVPEERTPYYGEGSSLSSVTSTHIGGAVGLGYTYAFSDVSMISGSILGGPSLLWSESRFDDEVKRGAGAGFYMNSRFGYSRFGSRSAWGMQIAFDAWEVESRSISISPVYFSFLTHYSYRF